MNAPIPLPLRPDLSEAERLLDILAPDLSEAVTFQTFDDDKERKNLKLVRVLHGDLDDHAAALQDLNRQGAGIFWMVNAGDGKARKASNVLRVRCLFVDLDGAPLEPAQSCPLAPHAVVESSPGRFHAYWVVSDCPLDRFGPLQSALAKRFDGDPAVKDLPRVMRVPGFLHQKDLAAPFTTRLLSGEALPPYTVARVVEALALAPLLEAGPPVKPVAPVVPAVPVKPVSASEVDRVRSALSYCGADGYNEWLNVGMALHHGFGGGEQGFGLWCDWAEQSAKFDMTTSRAKWEGFGRGGSGSLTLASLFYTARGAGWRDTGGPDPTEAFGQGAGTQSAPGGPDASTGNGWPAPQPFSAKVEREEYPLDALPRTLLAAVKEVNAFVQAPMAMAVCSALAALSLAIQAHYDVERAVNLRGPVGLALMAIGDSGERKTTLDGFFTKAIRDYENAQAEIAKPLLKNFRAATAAWEAKHSGIKDKIRQFAKESKQTLNLERDLRALEDEEPEAIKIPSLLHGDVTPEELARCMAKDWPSGGIISSEAGVVLGSHGMGKESAMRNFSLLNQLWDGGEVKIGRKTSESFTVRGARLTIALQVQEATLREFLRESGALARGTGFLARFLIAWPETTQGHRPFTEAPSSWPHLAAFNQRIAAILSQPAPLDENGGLVPVLLTLTTEAKAAWVVFHDAVESKVLSKNNLNNL